MEFDLKTKQILESLYPDFKVRVIRVYSDMQSVFKLSMRATEGIRTFATQAKYYAEGRTEPGHIITEATPGLSNHHYGVALDSCFAGQDPYLEKSKLSSYYWGQYAKLAEAHGLGAGLHFKNVDGPHIELMYGGLTVHDLFDLYKIGGIKSVWAKFDQIRNIPIGQEWSNMTLPDPGKIQ